MFYDLVRHPNRTCLVVFVSVLMLMLAVSPADRTASAQIRLGVVGGGNFASLSDISANGNPVSFDNASSFHAGVFLDLKLGPLNARPALYYLNAGSLFQGTSVFQDDNFNLTYITVPIDLVFNFGIGPLKPYFFVGPEFRIFTPSGVPSEVEGNIRNFVVNGSTGLGVMLSVPGLGFALYPHIRFSFGISDYTDDNYQVEGFSVSANDANVRMWLLSLGVAF